VDKETIAIVTYTVQADDDGGHGNAKDDEAPACERMKDDRPAILEIVHSIFWCGVVLIP
jgi:hypothetical protein